MLNQYNPINKIIMKKCSYYLLSFVMSVFVFASCSDDDDDIKFFSSDGEEVTSAFVSSIGHTTIKVTNTEGDFTVKSDNEEIATAAPLYDNAPTLNIQIKGHKQGTTVITVTDSKNRTARLNVTVYDRKSTLEVVEQHALIEIEGETEGHEEILGEIREDIISKLIPVHSGFVMTFTSDTEGKLIYYSDMTNETEKEEGTFKVETNEELQTRFFVFNYGEKEYRYQWANAKSGEKSSPPMVNLYLALDFTEDYNEITEPVVTEAKGIIKVIIH